MALSFIQVVAFFFADRGMGESSSKLVTEETFSNPPPLVLNDVGQDWLSVSWTAPSGGSIIKHKLQYSQVWTKYLKISLHFQMLIDPKAV